MKSNNINYTPLVCVRCMTFNHEAYIEDALNGFVIQQTTFPFVVAIINDASTDKTKSVINEFVENNCIFNPETEVRKEEYGTVLDVTHKDNPHCIFHIVHLNENHYGKKSKLPYFAKYENAAKYVAMCEGDDYWTDPLKLQKQVDFMEEHSDYSMCFSDYTNVNEYGETILWPNRKQNINRSYTGDIFAELLKGNYVQTCTMLYRKGITNDAEYLGRLDYELSLQCALIGKCSFIKEKTACYRLQPNSAIHTMNERLKDISNDVWRRYVCRYLKHKIYKRSFFTHVHIMSIITARMISMIRTKKQHEREIVDAILKANHILYVYMPLGTIIRFCNVVRKKLSLR